MSGGNPDASPAAEKPPSIPCNITLPLPYVDRLDRRVMTHGTSRSEEIRKAIDATEVRGPLSIDELAAASRNILAASMALRRLTGAGGAVGGFLDKIEAEAARIGILAST